MKFKGILAGLSPLTKLLVFFGIVVVASSLFTLLGFASANWIFGVNVFSHPEVMENVDNPAAIPVLKYVQMISELGMMIIPSLIGAYLLSFNTGVYLSAAKFPKSSLLFFVLVIMIVSTPMINYFIVLNEKMSLPASFAGLENILKQYEEKAALLTDAFLKMPALSDLIINILIIGLLPAIGEEFLFRGVFQNLFADLFSNKHAAIIFTAVLFSAIHLQFYGFIPRFLLGVYFGYLLLWSKTIWLPVAAHFVNNASAVIFAWYAQRNNLPLNSDDVGTKPGEWYLVLTSAVMVFVFSFFIFSKSKKALMEAES